MDWYQQVLGILTLIFGLSIVFLGLPLQIIKNYKDKRCGVPFLFPILAFGLHLTRGLYAWLISEPYIMIPDIAGLVMNIVLFSQYFIYLKQSPPPMR